MSVGRFFGKLFGGSGKHETVLRAYGKLPMYAEYRRLEVSPGAPSAYSQWLDHGRQSWMNSATKAEGGMTCPARLVLGFPDAREVVVASVWESRDSLGRIFPFSFFVVVPADALGNSPLQRWAVACEVHRLFDEHHARLHALGSGGDFYRLFAKTAVTLTIEGVDERVAALSSAAEQIDARKWFDEAGPDGGDAAAWFGQLQQRGSRWAQDPATLLDNAIGCPLAPSMSLDAQVAAWLEWFGDLPARAGRLPWFVVRQPGKTDAARLSLLLRDPLVDDYQLITSDDGAYGYVEHLAALAGNAAVEQATAPENTSLRAWLAAHPPNSNS